MTLAQVMISRILIWSRHWALCTAGSLPGILSTSPYASPPTCMTSSTPTRTLPNNKSFFFLSTKKCLRYTICWGFLPQKSRGVGGRRVRNTVYNCLRTYRLCLEGFLRKLLTGERNKMAKVPGPKGRHFCPCWVFYKMQALILRCCALKFFNINFSPFIILKFKFSESIVIYQAWKIR